MPNHVLIISLCVCICFPYHSTFAAVKRNNSCGIKAGCRVFRCRQAVEDGVRLSKDSLKELFTALTPPGTVASPRIPVSAPRDDDGHDVDAEDHRRSVREWMEKKKAERMKEFRRQLRELRDAEKHPFQPSKKTTKQV